MNMRGNNAMLTTVRISVTQEQRQLIEKYAFKNGQSISDAVRYIVEQHVRHEKLIRGDK